MKLKFGVVLGGDFVRSQGTFVAAVEEAILFIAGTSCRSIKQSSNTWSPVAVGHNLVPRKEEWDISTAAATNRKLKQHQHQQIQRLKLLGRGGASLDTFATFVKPHPRYVTLCVPVRLRRLAACPSSPCTSAPASPCPAARMPWASHRRIRQRKSEMYVTHVHSFGSDRRFHALVVNSIGT